ncbi:MAG: hypothetical protein ACFFAE_22950, partial [Candidatus Hodarchaeota archaeon]
MNSEEKPYKIIIEQKRYEKIFHHITRIINNFYHIIIPFLFGLITQIPRFPHPAEYDSFSVIYQAQLILKGHMSDWIIHPASIFGLYPYSGYPIGSPLLFSLFLFLCNGSVVRSVFIFSIFILLSILVTNTLFLREITNKRIEILMGNIFYILTPILYEFTYYTANARMMIFVLMPLVLFFLIKWQQ